MTESWQLVLLFIAGMILAAVYLGGLWWTVQTLPRARHPWLLYFGSTAIRLLTLLSALYLAMAGDWQRAMACLAGFLVLRFLVLYRFRDVSPFTAGENCECALHE